MLGLIIQCEVRIFCALYNSTFCALNLLIGITMHITYSNRSNQNNQENNLMNNITPLY